MSRFRFALRPRWILSHLLVLAVVAILVNLGFWQLRRLDEKRDRNQVVAARAAEPVAPVDEVLDVGADAAAIEAAAYRRVTAAGTYAADEEVLVRGRSLDGAPGSWVLTPLVGDNGTAVVVNRGWIPDSGQLERVPDTVETPSGPVEVRGTLLTSEAREGMGARDPEAGTLTNLARVDVARLARQVDERLVPAYVLLTEQDPAPGREAPRLLAAPSLDQGPHLSYALQWFAFATIAVVGYPLILRRAAADRDRDRADLDVDGPDPEDRLAADDPRRDAVHDRRRPG